MSTLTRRAVAEALGTALLLATVVGSGIMGDRLSGGNVAVALLANSLATGGGLIALILTLGPVSGAQFNPAVSVGLAMQGLFPWKEVPIYVIAQIVGAVLGVWAAHLMFELPVLEVSTKVRSGHAQLWSEFVATFGLLLVICGGLRARAEAIPYAVAAYIVAAYWFTASTSFANPAVTIARSLTNTFAGIRPDDVAGFIVVQLIGALAAGTTIRWLTSAPNEVSSDSGSSQQLRQMN